MVCLAHRAEEILTEKKRICMYTILTLLTLTIMGAALSIPLFFNEAWDCELTFYCLYGQTYRERRVLKHLVDGLIFFFVPFLISVALYYRVIRSFRNMVSNHKRNHSLTKAFIISNALWIFLWMPEFLFGVVFTNLGKLVENNSSKTTRRKQLVENTRRKTRRKATRRKFSGGKLVARIENNLRQI